MIRFLRAVATAIARFLANTTNKFLEMMDELLGKLSKVGAGGSGIATPERDIEAALPNFDEVIQAKELVQEKAKAADLINKLSPADQVQTFSMLDEEARMVGDLSLLTDAQVDWVNSLSEPQLRYVAETTSRRVNAALAGEPGALPGILSVGQADPNEETALASRITAYRAGSLTPPVVSYLH